MGRTRLTLALAFARSIVWAQDAAAAKTDVVELVNGGRIDAQASRSRR